MPRRERAVIGAVRLPSQRRWQIEESLEELAGLVEAAGGSVVERVVQERKAPSPALYFGKGKIDEIGQAAHARDANLFVSDDQLSPIQERNISKVLGIKVVDRTALILDIFAQRARSSEGKLQVELAQLTYLLPRLVGQWRHLERLGGGIGTRGPGETQLESDRRVIRRRVMKIRGELERVQVHRRLQRAGQRRMGAPVVALVGYTNAGKTTLLNRLAGVALTTADRLFVTLDPAARLVAGVVTLSVPHADGPALALCYERGRVLARADGPDAVRLEVQLPRALRARLAPYLIGPPAASIEMLD